MTDEELKNIKAPKAGEKKPLNEHQKRRNTVFLQLAAAALLFVFACVLVPTALIGTKYLAVVVLGHEDANMTTILSVVMFLAIVLAWFLSRQVCRIVVRKHLKDKITAEAVEMYK